MDRATDTEQELLAKLTRAYESAVTTCALGDRVDRIFAASGLVPPKEWPREGGPLRRPEPWP